MARILRRILLVMALSLAICSTLTAQQGESTPHHRSCCGLITPQGDRLTLNLDSMNVESLWLAGEHVNWETGEPDRGSGYEGHGNHSHCSAFAAAVAKKLGVYLLRPPDHSQELLANAQAKWLPSDAGQKAGWQSVSDEQEAQRLANHGDIVVVVFQDPDPHVPGHIAIVRPSEKVSALLQQNGPEIIMAGDRNYRKITVRVGFKNHPGAFPNGVRYYTHPVH